ncbi:MAG: hypothetical protein DSZ03_00855 [Sulfurimonas sp.]|nr:MAG: hypothetical protein DSZ03_00855 [Sulfurimonas sp.]
MKPLIRNNILAVFLYFLVSFALILPLWLQVNTLYNHTLTNIVFHLAALKYELTITQTHIQDKEIVFSFENSTPIKDFNDRMRVINAHVTLHTGSVTFNVPMTLALLLALTFSFRAPRKKKMALIAKSMLLLFLLHVVTLYVITLSTLIQSAESSALMHFYLNRFYLPREFIFNTASILNSYAARFEPFLLAIFVWWTLQSIKNKYPAS